jgi:hypothetical protein
MTKKQIKVRETTVSPYDFNRTLKDVKGHIDFLIASYGEDAELEWDGNFHYDYDSSPSPHFEVNIRREENDTEYNKRLQDEAERKVTIEKREAAEFARLQKKFMEKK